MSKYFQLTFNILFILFLPSIVNADLVFLDSCTDLTESDSEYILTQDIESSVTCFNIEGNNIIFDGNGHSINGDGTFNQKAIAIANSSNVETNDTTILGYNKGISVQFSQNITIRDNILHDISSQGITVDNTSNCSIYNNLIEARDQITAFDGITLSNSSNNLLELNTIRTFSIDVSTVNNGINLFSSTQNTIQKNEIFLPGGGDDGITVANSNDNEITDNLVETKGAGSSAILFYWSQRNRICHNDIVVLGAGLGINIHESNANAFSDNHISGNAANPVQVVGPTNANVFDGTTFDLQSEPRNGRVFQISNAQNIIITNTDLSSLPFSPEIIFLSRSEQVFIIDTDIRSSLIGINNSSYFRQWHLSLTITDDILNLIDATISISGTSKNENITIDGSNLSTILTSYFEDDDGATFYTPHFIHISSPGYYPYSETIFLLHNHDIHVILNRLLGDLNGDGKIDEGDHALFMRCRSDVQNDGVINLLDLSFVKQNMSCTDNSFKCTISDTNNDGIVSMLDYDSIKQNLFEPVRFCHLADFDGNGVVDNTDANLISR